MLPSILPPDLEAPDKPRAFFDDAELPTSVQSEDGSGFAALVASMLRCRRCSVLLTDTDGHRVVEDAIGLPASARGIRIPMGRGIAGRVAAGGVPLVVRSGSEAPPDCAPAGAYGTDSY